MGVTAAPPSARTRSTWNFSHLGAAFVIAAAIQLTMLPCLCYVGTIKGKFALMIDGVIIARIIGAWLIGEKNRGWIFYVVLLYSSPAWIEFIFWLHGMH